MTPVRWDPARALEVLHAHGVEHIVVGAFSAVAQGYPLATQDLDVTPRRAPDNFDRLAAALAELNARLRLPREEELPFPLDAKMLWQNDAWTLQTDAGPLDLDVVPAGTRGYEDLRADAVADVIDGVPVLLASLRDVIRMKEASNRPKDNAQLPALRQTLEVIRARERGKDG